MVEGRISPSYDIARLLCHKSQLLRKYGMDIPKTVIKTIQNELIQISMDTIRKVDPAIESKYQDIVMDAYVVVDRQSEDKLGEYVERWKLMIKTRPGRVFPIAQATQDVGTWSIQNNDDTILYQDVWYVYKMNYEKTYKRVMLKYGKKLKAYTPKILSQYDSELRMYGDNAYKYKTPWDVHLSNVYQMLEVWCEQPNNSEHKNAGGQFNQRDIIYMTCLWIMNDVPHEIRGLEQ